MAGESLAFILDYHFLITVLLLLGKEKNTMNDKEFFSLNPSIASFVYVLDFCLYKHLY